MKMKSNIKPNSGPNYAAMATYEAGIMQASVNRNLQKQCDTILKPYGITKSQWLLIGTVLDEGKKGARVSDLANQLDTTLSYLTNTINLLESRNILVRNTNDNDGRAKIVTIHPEFKKKCSQIEKTLRDGLRNLLYAKIDPNDFNAYMKVLSILSNFDKPTTK